jgi:GNAT superfamily N-acetyltransferase
MRQHRPAGPEAPHVRLAAHGERAVIREILRSSYGQYEAHVPSEVWRPYFADLLDLDRHARDGQLLVAVVDGEIAGYAAFYPDASAQGFAWPPGWAGARGMAVRSPYRGHGVAAALLAELERRARAAGAAVFAFHTSAFMTTAVALYDRLGYRRAPQFDIDVNAFHGVHGARPWPAIAYLRRLSACPGVRAA